MQQSKIMKLQSGLPGLRMKHVKLYFFLIALLVLPILIVFMYQWTNVTSHLTKFSFPLQLQNLTTNVRRTMNFTHLSTFLNKNKKIHHSLNETEFAVKGYHGNRSTRTQENFPNTTYVDANVAVRKFPSSILTPKTNTNRNKENVRMWKGKDQNSTKYRNAPKIKPSNHSRIMQQIDNTKGAQKSSPSLSSQQQQHQQQQMQVADDKSYAKEKESQHTLKAGGGQAEVIRLDQWQKMTEARNQIQNNLRMLGRVGLKFKSMADSIVSNDPSTYISSYNYPVTVRPDTCSGCFELNFPTIINERALCSSSRDTDLLILISSNPSKQNARSAIRKTWGMVCKDSSSPVRCVFVVGLVNDSLINEKIQEESDRYHDIVQIGFKDTYGNLTYKTMTALQWASKYCSTAKYLMKTDDDMYVNTRLLPLLLRDAPKKDFFGGFCWGPSRPHRDTSSKWHVPYHLFAGSSYPPMCSGTGYILTPDVARRTLAISTNIPFFYLEDVYIALCVSKLKILPRKLLGFNNLLQPYDVCSYKNAYITSHGLSAEQLLAIWSNMKTCPNIVPDPLYRQLMF